MASEARRNTWPTSPAVTAALFDARCTYRNGGSAQVRTAAAGFHASCQAYLHLSYHEATLPLSFALGERDLRRDGREQGTKESRLARLSVEDDMKRFGGAIPRLAFSDCLRPLIPRPL
jgi:hypothetical protein